MTELPTHPRDVPKEPRPYIPDCVALEGEHACEVCHVNKRAVAVVIGEARREACYACASDALEAQRAITRPGKPTRACPCECNEGGFCGGCGHAGCGVRGASTLTAP